ASAAVSSVRCHRSWWAVSATAQPRRWWSCALSDASSLRLAFKLPDCGKCTSITSTATKPPPISGELALDLARRVRLEHVALLHIAEVPEDDAALEAGGDLSDVVVEPLQRRDLAVVDDGAVAHEANLRAARDPA